MQKGDISIDTIIIAAIVLAVLVIALGLIFGWFGFGTQLTQNIP